MKRFAHAFPAASLTLAIALAACAAPGESTGPIGHPSGNDLVLRFEYAGGMIAGASITGFPPFTLSGDGRVMVPGAQIEVFPGPALPAANVRRLTEAGIQAVLAEVARTGLFGVSIELRGAQNFVADGGETVFTLRAEGREVKVLVYALGLLDPAGSYPGVSASEIAAHRTLQQLTQRLSNLDAWLPAGAWAEPDWRPYRPDALRLLVRNADADPPDGSGIRTPLADWPDEANPATFGEPSLFDQRCGVVSGQRAKDWYAALDTANQLTRFVKDGHRYQVTVRLQLPDEPLACPT
jgi:hypothetical protein